MKIPDLNHFETQYGTLGRPFRLSGVSKATNRQTANDWIYSFKYLDKDGGYFSIKICADGRVVKM